MAAEKTEKKKEKKNSSPIERITAPLLAWYDGQKRSLPWRKDRDPYRIWVSEIMLQQTRATAVIPYYQRFLEALPDVKALSEAEEEKLLKLWEGLGYYSRVRNMHKAARILVSEYGGEMPRDYVLLQKLPGIGTYTAGAIASIAFDLPVPAVDGNAARIFSRLLADDSDISDPATKRRYTELFASCISKQRPGDVNQALMDLGSGVCLPGGKPKCEDCPLQQLCRAHEKGREDAFPVKRKTKERRIEKKTVLLIRDGSHTYLQKRPSRGLLAGMYEFPMLEGWAGKKEALRFTQELGLQPLSILPSVEAKHIFTHKEWHMRSYQIRVADTVPEEKRNLRKSPMAVLPEEIDRLYPLPSAFGAFRSLL